MDQSCSRTLARTAPGFFSRAFDVLASLFRVRQEGLESARQTQKVQHQVSQLKKEVEQQVRQKVIPKTAAEVARQRLQQSRTSSDEAEPEPQPDVARTSSREARCDSATKRSCFTLEMILGTSIDKVLVCFPWIPFCCSLLPEP